MASGCTGCSSSTPAYYTNPLRPCTATSSSETDAAKIIYTGIALSCLNVASGEDLETILSKVNSVVCSSDGVAWDTFDYGCLPDEGVEVTNAQDFAEGISSLYCDLKAAYTTFTGTTYVAGIANLQTQINSINAPAFTGVCAAVGTVSGDTLRQAIVKINTYLCTVSSAINPSGANWNQCQVVSPAPTTITAAINVLIDWICDLQDGVDGLSTALPTFNNIGTCLASPGATDSLYNTIIKIRTYLCDLPTFDIDNVEWTSCIPKEGTTLEDALNSMLPAIQAAYEGRVVTWDEDYFVTSLVDPEDPCSGLEITLNPEAGSTDRLVALDVEDTPGYLLQKLAAGTGITFDLSATPGKITVVNSGTNTYKVKVNSIDSTTGYLAEKVVGQYETYGLIGINVAASGDNGSLVVKPVINWNGTAGKFLTEILSDSELLEIFRGMVCAAQPCTTTTTTTSGTTLAGVRSIITHIGAEDDDPISVSLRYNQTTPTVLWYNSGNVTLEPGDTINSGAFPITTSSNPRAGVLTLTSYDTNTFGYTIYVEDLSGNPISGSTTASGTLTAGAQVEIDPFNFGVPASNYVVRVDLE